MRKGINLDSKKFDLLRLEFLSYAYFFSLASSLLFILISLGLNSLPLAFLQTWAGWSDFKCSWECLRSKVAAFIIGDGFRAILACLVFFLFIRALFLSVRRIKETKKFKENLESIALPQETFEVKYFLFPFAYPLALTIGWFKPKIFLSTSLVNSLRPEELKIIIFHEAFHQKKRDPLKNLLLSFLADLLFFFPMTKKMKELFGLSQELRADFQATNDGKDLSSLLISLNKIYKPSSFLSNLSYFSAPPSNDHARWQYLKTGHLKFNLSWRQAVISFLILVFFFFVSFSPFWPGARKTILEHKSTCFSHSIIEEGQAQ